MDKKNLSASGGFPLGGKDVNYQEIIKKALVLTWNNKFLWLFGFFIFLGSISANMNIGSVSNFDGMRLENMFLEGFMQKYPFVIEILVAAMVLILFVSYLLKLVGIAATIKTVNNVSVYRQIKATQILANSGKYVFGLILLDLLIGLPVVLAVSALFVPVAYLFVIDAKLLAGLFFASAILIVTPLAILAFFMKKYAQMYFVIGEMKLRLAVEEAYVLLESNMKESLIMGLIVSGLSAIAFALSLILVAISSSIVVFFGLLLYIVLAKALVLVVFIVGGIFEMILLVTTYSWFEAFIQALWVLFFQQIALRRKKKEREVEKVEIKGGMPNPEPV